VNAWLNTTGIIYSKKKSVIISNCRPEKFSLIETVLFLFPSVQKSKGNSINYFQQAILLLSIRMTARLHYIISNTPCVLYSIFSLRWWWNSVFTVIWSFVYPSYKLQNIISYSIYTVIQSIALRQKFAKCIVNDDILFCLYSLVKWYSCTTDSLTLVNREQMPLSSRNEVYQIGLQLSCIRWQRVDSVDVNVNDN
jgi:hypothetical protein